MSVCPRIIRTPARGRCPCLRVPVSVLASLYRFCRLLFPSVGENIVFSAELSPAGARGFRLSSRARGLAFSVSCTASRIVRGACRGCPVSCVPCRCAAAWLSGGCLGVGSCEKLRKVAAWLCCGLVSLVFRGFVKGWHPSKRESSREGGTPAYGGLWGRSDPRAEERTGDPRVYNFGPIRLGVGKGSVKRG